MGGHSHLRWQTDSFHGNSLPCGKGDHHVPQSHSQEVDNLLGRLGLGEQCLSPQKVPRKMKGSIRGSTETSKRRSRSFLESD